METEKRLFDTAKVEEKLKNIKSLSDLTGPSGVIQEMIKSTVYFTSSKNMKWFIDLALHLLKKFNFHQYGKMLLHFNVLPAHGTTNSVMTLTLGM